MPKSITQQLAEAETIQQKIDLLTSARNAPMPDFHKISSEIDPYKHRVMDELERPDKKIVVDVLDEEGMPTGKTKTEYVKVARVTTSMQQLIVNRAVSFMFGNDLVISADTETDAEKAALQAIKSVMIDIDARTNNRSLAREVFTTTEGAELWYVTESEPHSRYGFKTDRRIRCAIFKPSEGEMLYPYFDDQRNLLAFSRRYTTYINPEESATFFETWTAEYHYKWRLSNEDWEEVEGYPEKIAIGKIPVVFVSQPKPEWADVQPLIDRLERLLSNFADTNDYHASPKIFTTGTIVGLAKKGEAGQILEGEEGATAQYLSWSQAPTSVQTEFDTLMRLIYTETQTPDISFDTLKGINTSGVSLKMMFMDAHLKVQDKLEYFSVAFRRRSSIVKSLLAEITPDTAMRQALMDINVDTEVRPYIVTDEAAEVATYAAACGNKAVMSRKTAVERLGYVNDTDAEVAQIESEEQAGQGMTSIQDLTY